MTLFSCACQLGEIGGKYQNNVDDCKCQCLPHLDAFREDLNICVDDIHGKRVFNLNK